MVGELHLTRLDGLVQLRTQFHHIDASAQLEAVQRRREKESQEGAKVAEPKAFLAQVKKTGGDTAAELTQAFMKATNQEPWQRLNYFDEDVSKPFNQLRAPADLRRMSGLLSRTTNGSLSRTLLLHPSCRPRLTTAPFSMPSA